KAHPQSLDTFGSAGAGTVFHLTGELFKQLTGLPLQHVPYRGGGPTVTALLAGEVPLAFETMLALQPHVRAGALRALAITSARRSTVMPDIPTTAEAGFPSLVADNSYALFAPAGTPADVLARLHDASVAALALPDMRDRLREQGAEVVGSRQAELAAYVASEIPKWAALARQAGIKPELSGDKRHVRRHHPRQGRISRPHHTADGAPSRRAALVAAPEDRAHLPHPRRRRPRIRARRP